MGDPLLVTPRTNLRSPKQTMAAANRTPLPNEPSTRVRTHANTLSGSSEVHWAPMRRISDKAELHLDDATTSHHRAPRSRWPCNVTMANGHGRLSSRAWCQRRAGRSSSGPGTCRARRQRCRRTARSGQSAENAPKLIPQFAHHEAAEGTTDMRTGDDGARRRSRSEVTDEERLSRTRQRLGGTQRRHCTIPDPRTKFPVGRANRLPQSIVLRSNSSRADIHRRQPRGNGVLPVRSVQEPRPGLGARTAVGGSFPGDGNGTAFRRLSESSRWPSCSRR